MFIVPYYIHEMGIFEQCNERSKKGLNLHSFPLQRRSEQEGVDELGPGTPRMLQSHAENLLPVVRMPTNGLLRPEPNLGQEPEAEDARRDQSLVHFSRIRLVIRTSDNIISSNGPKMRYDGLTKISLSKFR